MEFIVFPAGETGGRFIKKLSLPELVAERQIGFQRQIYLQRQKKKKKKKKKKKS